MEELLPIIKIDKKGKKVIEWKGRRRLRKYLNEKRRIKMVTKSELPKNHSNKGTQTNMRELIRCKSLKCYNKSYKYKTTECLEQYDRLHNSQHEEKNYKN